MDALNLSLRGTYALVMRVGARRGMRIGALGSFDIEVGDYVYVGSALGPGGVGARIAHHLGACVRPHWHIDYLLKAARVREVWWTISDRRYECVWAEAMRRGRGAKVAIAGFGASDCRCGSHLFRFDAEPSIVAFRRRLRGVERGHEAVVCRRV